MLLTGKYSDKIFNSAISVGDKSKLKFAFSAAEHQLQQSQQQIAHYVNELVWQF